MAARLLIERAIPAMKPIELPVELPLPEDAGLADQGRAVVSALAGGLIAPGQAAQILTALAGIARLVELDESRPIRRCWTGRTTRQRPALFTRRGQCPKPLDS